jgi:class 3 adenylate cyclase/tetratricopeptide (TPR) repeat protein
MTHETRPSGPPSDQRTPGDERRLVTILFADLAGFTGLAEHLDPEEVQDLLNSCFDCLVPCVERYGGSIDKFMGDALMALFGAPVAHERDPEGAILAALDILASLAQFNQERHLELAVHIGINTGRVLAGSVGGGGRRDYSVVGDAVNLASRLEDLSAPNEILIGPQTFALAGSLFEIEEAGTVTVRGRTEAAQAYRVLGEKPSVRTQVISRLAAPMVGRERELAVLTGALDRLAQQGQGEVVYVLGEAGLGKSRLLAEARGAGRSGGCSSDPFAPGPLTWLEGQAASLGQSSSYGPLKQIIEQDAGLSSDQDLADRFASLTRRLAVLLPEDHKRQLAPLAALFGLPTQSQARDWLVSVGEEAAPVRLKEALVRYFEGLAAQGPVVLVFEDCHWLDASSIAVIERLLPLVRTVSLLLCLVARSEMEDGALDPERAATRVAGAYEQIRLAPLTRAESRHLVAELLGSQELPAGLQQAIERRAEGNPFFIQEILRSFIDLGGLEPDGKGGWWLTGRLDLSLPDTLEGSIVARADRLPEETRQTLRLASVVGRGFDEPLLLTLTGLAEAELERQLRRLQDMELIRGVQPATAAAFVFTHSLIQEAIYDGLTARERRALHARVAEELEALATPHQEDYHGILAYHYGKAERWDQARDHLLKAGERAGDLGAGEATDCYQQALETLLRGYSPGAESEADSQATEWFLAGVAPFFRARRLGSISGVLEEFHKKTSEVFGADDRRTLAAAEMLGTAWLEQFRSSEALAILERTLAAREALGDARDPSLARLLHSLGGALFEQERHEEAEAVMLRGLDLQMAATTRDSDILARLYMGASYIYRVAGRTREGREVLQTALAIPEVRQSSDAAGLLANLADLEARSGLLEDAVTHIRLGMEVSTSAWFREFCRLNLGSFLGIGGRYAEAMPELQQAAEALDTLEKPWELGVCLADLAECQLQQGELASAERSARRALSLLESLPKTDYKALSAYAWLALSGVALARGDLKQAEDLIASAIPFLTVQYLRGDKEAEAAILYRRAQLRLKQGRVDDAQADFARALALLAELGGEEHGRRKVMLAEWERLASEGCAEL